MRKINLSLFCFIGFLLIIAGSLFGRTDPNFAKNRDSFNSFSTVNPPAYCIVNHRIGKIVLAVKNNGTFGIMDGDQSDCLTGDQLYACEYPKNSRSRYLFGAAFWIGAIVGRDTLVSEGADGWDRAGNEFNPSPYPIDTLETRSITYPDNPALFDGAVSEEDYIAIYNDLDTEIPDNDESGRPHTPLNIEITQKSYAWSYPYAEDFVLFDYEIRNIGVETLNATYMGIYVDADVHAESATAGHTDDFCGYIHTIETKFLACSFIDTVNIAWIADDDGDPNSSDRWDNNSVRHVTATRIIRTPADKLDVSFNWWVSNPSPNLDFGPREKEGVGRLKEDFRIFYSATLGTPDTDADKYYQLSNQEFDYDQHSTSSIQPTDTLWQYPPQDLARDLSDGYDTRYLLSFGPFDINPGEKLPLSFAYIGGENLHNNPVNAIYDDLDFTDLGKNAIWASRVYDNPGIDTDGDLYFGKFRECCLDSTFSGLVDTTYDTTETVIDTIYSDIFDFDLCDTLFYEGDGVPDFKGASPPPAPTFWLTPTVGKIHVRFNGVVSETVVDVFSRVVDFEGYRVYLGRDNRASSFSQVASYDIDDYSKYVYNPKGLPVPGFELSGIPATLDKLRCAYGTGSNYDERCNDTTFHPMDYTRTFPFIHPDFADSIFYFETQDFNASLFDSTTPITKIYPNAEYPSTIFPDSALPGELTEDGYFKYFEYELTIENLLPTIQWWVNVTAFDFGSPISGLPSLETALGNGAKHAYAINAHDEVETQKLEAFVFPNPYRNEGDYKKEGYEGRMDVGVADDRIREIHFVNLPLKCKISIYSIDGDLIRSIEHESVITDAESTHETWDLITRNTQLVASGLYYWIIEEDNGETQIGKLVIIM